MQRLQRSCNQTPASLRPVQKASFLSSCGLLMSPLQTFPFEGRSIPTPNPSLWKSCSFGFWKNPEPSFLFSLEAKGETGPPGRTTGRFPALRTSVVGHQLGLTSGTGEEMDWMIGVAN